MILIWFVWWDHYETGMLRFKSVNQIQIIFLTVIPSTKEKKTMCTVGKNTRLWVPSIDLLFWRVIYVLNKTGDQFHWLLCIVFLYGELYDLCQLLVNYVGEYSRVWCVCVWISWILWQQGICILTFKKKKGVNIWGIFPLDSNFVNHLSPLNNQCK